MKHGIHPKYNDKVTATCACGAVFLVGSTEDELHVEICSNCHPFFTGKQKLVDTAGRVDKFRARVAASKKTADGIQKVKQEKEESENSSEVSTGSPEVAFDKTQATASNSRTVAKRENKTEKKSKTKSPSK